MDKWFSFRPISSSHSGSVFSRSRKISSRFTIKKLPKWARSKKTLENYTSILTRGIKGASIAISTNYEAESLGHIQKNITEELALLPLAFWLSGTPLTVADEIIHLQHENNYTSLRSVVREDRIYIAQEEGHLEVTEKSFQTAKKIFARLCELPRKGTVRIAVWSILTALKEKQWPLRYLLYWLALEALFGPEDGREITFRISQRIALFLRKGDSAEKYSKTVKKSYGWRSAVVHGLRLKNLNGEQSAVLMRELEAIVRECLIQVIKPKYFEIFDSKKREEFLDKLVYSK